LTPSGGGGAPTGEAMAEPFTYASVEDLHDPLYHDPEHDIDGAREEQLTELLVDATNAIDQLTLRSFAPPAEQPTKRLNRPSRDGSMIDLLDDIAKEDDITVEVRSMYGGEWVVTDQWYPVVANGGGIYVAGMVTDIHPVGSRRFRREGQLQTIRVTAHFG